MNIRVEPVLISNKNNLSCPSFGYNYMTHRVITQKAIQSAPELKNIVREIVKDDSFSRKLLHKLSIVDIVRAFQKKKKAYKKMLNTHAMHNVGLDMLLATKKRKLTSFEKFIDEITNGSMMPDLLKSEIGFGTNSHFFFLPDGRYTSKSFGFNNKKNNALASFIKHVANIEKTKNSPNLPQEIGMALHYIQDVTVPMHTQRANIKIFKNTPFLGKIVDLVMHSKFENNRIVGMVSRHKEMLKAYKPRIEELRKTLPENYTLEDLFMSNVAFSTEPSLQVTRANKNQWKDIQQKIFNRAIDSTVLALEKFSKTIKTS